MSELYTTSRLKVLRECLRKHFYRYRVGIQGPETEAMRFGTATHSAIEAYLRAWQAGADRVTAALAAIAASVLGHAEQTKLRALILGYDLMWGSKNWEILAVEVEFRYELGDVGPLGTRYSIGGKIDAIIRDLDDGGRVFVVEHKTTGRDASPGSAYWEKLTIDCQLSIYVDGATTLGYDIAGCIYDVLAKPQHEPKLATPAAEQTWTIGKGCKLCGGNLQGKQGSGTTTATTDGKCAACKGSGWRLKEGDPEAPRLHKGQREVDESPATFELRVGDAIADDPMGFYMREVIVRPETELVRMRSDLIDWIKLDQMSRIMFSDEPPRNDGACFNFHQRCPYLSACKGEADINDQFVYPRSAAHPELAAA